MNISRAVIVSYIKLYSICITYFGYNIQKARIGRSQSGVGLWSPHFFVLSSFKSGLTLNPHNKCHSFGLFISLYLCCVVDIHI